ncbi:MAG: type II secretion system protein [Minisyncoccia bacterium]
MNLLKNKEGFTLIELLVVITIIGILASVVLVSFPTATKTAKDSRIVSAIGQARAIMAYLYTIDGNYSSFSCSYIDMQSLCQEITKNGGTPTIATKDAPDPKACIYSPLTAKTNYWYCADSTGKAGYTTTSPAGTSYCVNNVAVCPPVQ